MRYLVTAILLLAIAQPVLAKRLHPERWYQEQWCDGQIEVVLADNTRVDCLTDDVAWEFDFADKWAEAIGQSLHYGAMTDRQAGIVMIVESLEDLRYANRLLSVIHAHYLDIKVRMLVDQ